MERWTRRRLLVGGAALGASVAFATYRAWPSRRRWHEKRDLFPEGVASGDPTSDGVVLWTRRPFTGRIDARLYFEVAEDREFHRVVADGTATVSERSDWTCRVLVTGLQPARVYWYRFSDESGAGSRIGRTITAPADDDPRPVRFAFVSCQNVNLGAQTAYRRMIFEDERSAESDRIDFVLHLGDFIYELVWYPEDRPQGMYDRRVRDLVRYAGGERIDDFHIPTTVDDYRAVYRAYLHDADLQDARARWPFVAMWDNHEFSWLGWQGFQVFDGKTRPAQTRKVAANQAWFEYQPARVERPGGTSLEPFDPPRVVDVPVSAFDDAGLGQEPNNLAAITSLTGYRALRWGRHVDLIITDQHSYRSEDPSARPEVAALSTRDFPEMFPEEALAILDAGREHEGGAPATIRFGAQEVPNFRRDQPPQTILGAQQKKWFLERLGSSAATWKIWANSQGTLDARMDPQNLPSGITKPWPGAGYASLGGGDASSAYLERAEIYDHVRRRGITGFATVSGDRHSFWAGLAAKALPPLAFEPVGVAFITGSVSAPGIVEALEHALPGDHPLRALYLAQPPGESAPHPSLNLLMLHGVRACLEYQRSGELARARQLSNPELAPHLSFLDMGGHGYAVVRASGDTFECEFVCIPRPLEPGDRPDGGPLAYRVVHRAPLWTTGGRPRLDQRVIDGDPGLSIR
jgi:alkaline phosphatase D